MGQEFLNRFGVENRFHRKIIFHLSFDIFHLSSGKTNPRLSNRAKSKMMNEKCQMTDGKWFVSHLGVVTAAVAGFLRL